MTSTVLDALRIKPFDLQALYESWTSPPIFVGTVSTSFFSLKQKTKNENEFEDPVAWLIAVKAGCKERKVPKDYWYRVGRHYMAATPRARLDELGKVMQQMTGDKHVWNWRKFKIAVQNLGLGGSPGPKSKTMPVPEKQSASPPAAQTTQDRFANGRPVPKKQGSWWIMGRNEEKDVVVHNDKNKNVNEKVEKLVLARTTAPDDSPSPIPAVVTASATASVPSWLLNACSALDFLTADNTRTMSALSAILITVGAIPATLASIPAIGAGAGGAAGVLLTGHAAQTVGAVAVGLGQALKAMGDQSKPAEGEMHALPVNGQLVKK